jgi:hypothetical protein
MENLINALAPVLIVIVACIILLWDNEGGHVDETNRTRPVFNQSDYICYDAFENLSKEEFLKLPRELRQEVPDKCRFCRWKIECDPLEIAAATTFPCGNFTVK